MFRLQRIATFSVLAFLVAASPAVAANVAFYSSYFPPTIVPAPHTATAVTLAQIEGGALAGYDVLLIGHVDGAAGNWSAAACTAVGNFLAAGGGVVTEWNGVDFLFDAQGGSIYFPMGAPQCGLFTGTVDFGTSVGIGTPIDVINPASPTMTGLSDPFSMGGGSDYMYTVSGFGAEWTVDAQFTGHGGTWPSVMWANYGAGTVVVGTSDFFDVLPGDATATQLLDNLITFADTGALVAVNIPTVGQFGLVLLVMLLALAGVAILRAVKT
jgi:hypothetical protein